MLYTPPHFSSRDQQAIDRLIAESPFATLITSGDGDEASISHLPLLRDGEVLWGHMARANPHWHRFAAGHTVAVFHGPHAYVSPRWYERPEVHVPTWNYAVVHVGGRPEILGGAAAQEVLVRVTAHFDPQFVLDAANLQRLLPGIVAFRMPITRLDAKFKMNQNRSPADRAGVIAQLANSERVEEQAVADWMRSYD